MNKYLSLTIEYLPAIKIFAAFALGAFIGSLACVTAARLTAEGKPRISECALCGGKYETLGLLPAILRLKLTGKCRTCGKVTPGRRIFVELISASCCAIFAWQFDASYSFVFALVALAFWLLHSLTDIENGYIYDSAALAMVIAGALLRLQGGIPALVNGVLGAGLGFGLIIIIMLLTGGAMGSGDAMLMLGTGALLGWKLTLASLYFGLVIGGIFIVPLIFAQKVRTKDSVPLAPFIAAGGIVSVLIGKWAYASFGITLMWPWTARTLSLALPF